MRRSWSRAAAPQARRAFTLVELLVVIAIIGVLIALLLPAVQAARESARRIQCRNNLRQVALAIHLYHDAYKRLPMTSPFSEVNYDAPGGTWAALILPFMEQQNIHSLFDFKKRMADPVNAKAVATPVPTYVCPADENAAKPIFTDRNDGYGTVNPKTALGLWYPVSMGPTSTDSCPFCTEDYCCQGANYGTSPPNNSVGMFGRHPRGFAFPDVTDGLSNTLMLGETAPGQCAYLGAYAPNFPLAGTTIPLNTFEECLLPPGCHTRGCGFKSYHTGGVQFAMGDASVTFLADTIDYRVINQLGTREGAEAVSVP